MLLPVTNSNAKQPVSRQTPERISPGLYRRGNTIFARITVDGRRTFRSTGTNDPVTARKVLKAWHEQQVLREHGIEVPVAALERNRLTVDEILADYEAAGFPDRHSRIKAPATQKHERKCLPRVRAYFAKRPAVTLTLRDCDAFRDWRKSGGYIWQQWGKTHRSNAGSRTVDTELQTLTNALTLAVRRGKLKVNPLAGRKPYRCEQETTHCRQLAPTPSELRLIEHSLRQRGETVAADCIVFLACSGLRIGEALPLEWEDVDWPNEVVHVKREKRGYNPFVPLLLSDLAKLLREMQARSHSNFLFPSERHLEKPMAYPTIAGHLNRTARSLGLKRITLHGMRSYFVTRCREADLSDAEISALIGDKTGPAIIARVYGDVLDTHLVKQAQRVRSLVTQQQEVEPHPVIIAA